MFCHLWAQSTWPHLALLRSLPGEGTNRETKAQGQIFLAPKTPSSSGLRQTSEALLLLQPSLCLGHCSAPAELVPTMGPGPKGNPPHCCLSSAPSTSFSCSSPGSGPHGEKAPPPPAHQPAQEGTRRQQEGSTDEQEWGAGTRMARGHRGTGTLRGMSWGYECKGVPAQGRLRTAPAGQAGAAAVWGRGDRGGRAGWCHTEEWVKSLPSLPQETRKQGSFLTC